MAGSLLLRALLALAYLPTCIAVVHSTSLMWTQKDLLNQRYTKIVSIIGPPREWVINKTIDSTAHAYPSDPNVRRISHRIALAFNYRKQEIFFSDRGYKNLNRIGVLPPRQAPYRYNVPVDTVFAGTSTEVHGMAVDWVSGSLYWTDALYNWITVGSGNDTTIYRHIVTTHVDKPQGLAVDPKHGHLYWSDWGSVPKIERASLAGEERTTIVSRGLGRPRGLCQDYTKNRLFWVDDRWDSIEWFDLKGGQRGSFLASQPTQTHHNLFGIAIFEDMVFVTDQIGMQLKVYNETTSKYIGRYQLLAVPYDIMMYDSTLQEQLNSSCKTLDCQHMCISEADGGGHCMCAQNYDLQSDGFSCVHSKLFRKPIYLYTLGSSLCSAHINVPDHLQSEDVAAVVDCFLPNLTHVEALAFDVHSDLLFYSDTKEGTLNRLRLENDEHPRVMHINRGEIRGIAVDWLSSNLYWTDEGEGHIMVSRLDGSSPIVLIDEQVSPRGIAVYPSTGMMYWAAQNSVFQAHMDGSNTQVLWYNESALPDGLVLDARRDTLYWADNGLKAIWAAELNTNIVKSVISFPNVDISYRDVTVYQDYIAWSDGDSLLYFFTLESRPILKKILTHTSSNVSHDIITYDEYLQPLTLGQCDMDNGGCDHLCLPTPHGRTCQCSLGFHLTSNTSCQSEIVGDSFLLLMDPYYKRIFQLPLGERPSSPQGLHLDLAENPRLLTMDTVRQKVYWVDEDAEVIKQAPLMDSENDNTFITLPRGIHRVLGAIEVVESADQIVFTDVTNNSIYVVDGMSEPMQRVVRTSGHIHPTALAVHKASMSMFWVQYAPGNKLAIYKTSLPVPKVLREGFLNETPVILINDTGVKGLTTDGDYIYYWSDRAIYKCHIDDPREELLTEAEQDLSVHKVVADGDFLYISFTTLPSLLRYSQSSRKLTPYTSSVFTFISDVKIFRAPPTPTPLPKGTATAPLPKGCAQSLNSVGCPNSTDKPNGPANSRDGPAVSKSMNTLIYIGAGAAALVLLATILAVVCVVRRRRWQKTMRKPSHSDVTTGAHENPTYMSAEEVGIPLPPSLSSSSANVEGHYEQLPPLRVGLPDIASGNVAAAAADGYLDPVKIVKDREALGLGPCGEQDAGTDAPLGAVSDRVKLVVEEGVDDEEVVVSLDGIDGGAVSYSATNPS